MAFSVNVKLVENMVKSHDGRVKVAKVINQYKTRGITLIQDKIPHTMIPNHEEVCTEGISVANFDVVAFANSGMPDGNPNDGIGVVMVDIA